MVHLQNVQRHSSSHPTYAMRNRSADREAVSRSRSPAPRRSRVRLTPGPHGNPDEDDDWGDWTQQGHRRHDRLSHADRRRPHSPSAPPGRSNAASNSRTDNQPPTVRLIQLRVCTPSASLGSHVFALCSAYEVEEVAIRINDVLYYALPSIAALVYPEPSKWKQSWETAQPPLPPAVPHANPPVPPVPPQAASEPSNPTLPPLPPPRTPAPASPKAPPTRASVTSTLVATSATLADGDPIEPLVTVLPGKAIGGACASSSHRTPRCSFESF